MKILLGKISIIYKGRENGIINPHHSDLTGINLWPIMFYLYRYSFPLGGKGNFEDLVNWINVECGLEK